MFGQLDIRSVFWECIFIFLVNLKHCRALKVSLNYNLLVTVYPWIFSFCNTNFKCNKKEGGGKDESSNSPTNKENILKSF